MRLQMVDSWRCARENAATIPTTTLTMIRCLSEGADPDERLYTRKVQIAAARRSVAGRAIVAKLRTSRLCAATRLFARDSSASAYRFGTQESDAATFYTSRSAELSRSSL